MNFKIVFLNKLMQISFRTQFSLDFFLAANNGEFFQAAFGACCELHAEVSHQADDVFSVLKRIIRGNWLERALASADLLSIQSALA